MKKKRGKTAYSDEFRREAVRLAETKGDAVQVAKDLGVHPESLRNWCRTAARQRAGASTPSRVLLEEENRRLRKEVSVHPLARSHLSHHHDVSGAEGVEGRLLCVACTSARGAGEGGSTAERADSGDLRGGEGPLREPARLSGAPRVGAALWEASHRASDARRGAQGEECAALPCYNTVDARPSAGA